MLALGPKGHKIPGNRSLDPFLSFKELQDKNGVADVGSCTARGLSRLAEASSPAYVLINFAFELLVCVMLGRGSLYFSNTSFRFILRTWKLDG
ncbi:hypothetical protein Tco_0999990 [Tanacetum coccineum]